MYVTQILTGHGNFRSYLQFQQKLTDNSCHLCGMSENPAEREDVPHVLWHCTHPERVAAREELKKAVRPGEWPCPLPDLLVYGGKPFAVFARKVLTVKTCQQ